MLNRPQPTERPRIYTVDITGKIYQGTSEHLRRQYLSTFGCSGFSAQSHNTHITNDRTRLPLLGEGRPKDSTPTPEQSTSKLPSSEKQVDLQTASMFAASERTCFQPMSHVTRTGCVTQVPARFKDRIETNRHFQIKLFYWQLGSYWQSWNCFGSFGSFDRHLFDSRLFTVPYFSVRS